MRVRATDGGGRHGDARVDVTVTRNLNAPRFEPQNYEVQIQDNEPLASSFLTLTAVDDDEQVTSRLRYLKRVLWFHTINFYRSRTTK